MRQSSPDALATIFSCTLDVGIPVSQSCPNAETVTQQQASSAPFSQVLYVSHVESSISKRSAACICNDPPGHTNCRGLFIKPCSASELSVLEQDPTRSVLCKVFRHHLLPPFSTPSNIHPCPFVMAAATAVLITGANRGQSACHPAHSPPPRSPLRTPHAATLLLTAYFQALGVVSLKPFSNGQTT